MARLRPLLSGWRPARRRAAPLQPPDASSACQSRPGTSYMLFCTEYTGGHPVRQLESERQKAKVQVSLFYSNIPSLLFLFSYS